MTDAFDSLTHVDGPVDPDPTFRALLLDQLRDELTTDLDGHVDLSAAAPGRRHVRRPLALGMAALLVTAAAAVSAVAFTRQSRPMTPVERALHELGPAPAAPTGPVNARTPTPRILVVRHGYLALDGGSKLIATETPLPLPKRSPWDPWTDPSMIVTDLLIRGSGLWVGTCCGPDTGVWNSGAMRHPGFTRADANWSSVEAELFVNPGTSTLWMGYRDVVQEHVPGIVDAVVLADSPAGAAIALASEPMATLVLFPGGQRLALDPALHDACAMAAIGSDLVLLLGRPSGSRPCVGDIGVVVDAATGAFRSAFRFPAEVRSIESDHLSQIVAVTTDGHAVIGEPETTPTWISSPTADVIYAAYESA